ncbi:MAG TPA: MFS transporter [Gemmatimonadales bacterium]|nr:MFS transporter [Gemmatimonadales bacterium]
MSAPRSTAPLVLATVFVDIVGFGMILPILPGHAASLGISPVMIGVLVGAYSAIQLLLAPFWGRVSDRFGRRPVLLMGLFGSAASYLCFALAGNWWLLLLSRLLDGGSGATINVAQAYLADSTPPTERARAMGKVGATVGMGFIVGPMLGGITAARGVPFVALLAAGITAANLLMALRYLPESVRSVEPDVAALPEVPLADVLLPLTVLGLSTLAFSVMYVVFPLWGEETIGATRSTVSYWFALMGLVTAITQGGVLGRLVRKVGEAGTARGGMAFLAAGLAMIPMAGGGGARFYAVLALLGIGYGLAGPSMLGLISRRTGGGRQGSVLGVAQSVASLARIVGPVFAGAVMSGAGAEWAFLGSAGVATFGLVAVLVLGVRQLSPAR